MHTLSLNLSDFFSLSPLFITLVALLLLAIPVVATLAAPQLRQWQSNLLRFSGIKKNVVSEVTALRVYPIKSCRGFTVNKTMMQLHGLDLDRQWMFVDAKSHEFITIRQNSQMTLINTAISDDGQSLLLSISNDPDKKVVSIPARPSAEWLEANTTLEQVKIWMSDTDAHIYGPEVNDTFSKFLNQDVCLVYKGPTPRVLVSNGDPRILGRIQETYFPDVFPVLIASEASLAELNSRLTKKGVEPITIERFRPNIIVKGTAPWVEDTWKAVRFSHPASQSNEKKKMSKPLDADILCRCARCQVPNVEPNTARKHKTEPWNTLMSYRRIDDGMKFKPCFGMQAAPREEGEIEVGMKIEIMAETNEHKILQPM